MTEQEIDGQLNMERERVEAKIAGVKGMFNRLESADFTKHSRFRLDQDISDQEQAAQFLRNYRRVGLLKERLLERALPRLGSDLEKFGQVEPEQRQLPHVVVDEVKRELQLGEKSFSFTGVVEATWAGLLYYLRNSNQDIEGELITQAAINAGSQADHPARDITIFLRRKMEKDAKNPELFTRGGSTYSPKYRLNATVEFVGEKGKDKEGKPGDEVIGEGKLSEFDVRLSDGLVVKTEGSWEMQALRKLDELGGTRMPIAELSVLVFPNDAEERGINRIMGIIAKLNRLLSNSSKQVIWEKTDVWLQDKSLDISKQGEEGVQTEEVYAKHRLVFLENNQVELDGRIIRFGPKELNILKALARHVNEEVISKNLSQEALNNPDPRSSNLSSIIRDIKGKLNQEDIFDSLKASKSSWIKLQNVEVVWPEDENKEVNGDSDDGDEIESSGTSADALGQPVGIGSHTSVDEWEFVPYEPTTEEVRSEEETRVLEVVAETLIGHNRLWFDQLQRDLVTIKRLDKISEGHFRPHIYNAIELNNIFDTALQKLNREESRPLLRQRWIKRDEHLLNIVSELMQKWNIEGTGQLLRRIRREVETAEREYYNENHDSEYYRLKHMQD